MRDNSQELLPIVDEEGHQIGKATRGECHGAHPDGVRLLHPVVHLHVFNSRGELYLQKRPDWKDIQPGKWDTAVGGHIDLGEGVDKALRREAREELEITDFVPKFVKSYVFESERERELVNVFLTVTDEPVSPTRELDGGRFWTPDEIEEAITHGLVTPNFAQEYTLVVKPYVAQSLTDPIGK